MGLTYSNIEAGVRVACQATLFLRQQLWLTVEAAVSRLTVRVAWSGRVARHSRADPAHVAAHCSSGGAALCGGEMFAGVQQLN